MTNPVYKTVHGLAGKALWHSQAPSCAILFAATTCVVPANAVENEYEPDEITSAHATEVHASAAVQEKQKVDDVASATSVCAAVCKEIHYVPPKDFFGLLLLYITHIFNIVW